MVALLISSIGLVSVATLFPMSVLRSIKAAQATSAADARINAEAAIDRYPDMIKHPDSRNPAYRDIPANNGNIDVDPDWLKWQLSGVHNYVVDPLGYAAVRSLGLTIGNNNAVYMNRPEHFFGNDPSNNNLPPWPKDPPGTPWLLLPRYPLTWRTMADADYLVTLPDSWVLQYETIGGTLATGSGAANSTQITIAGLNFSPTLAGNPTPNLPSPTVRVVMFSADGAVCQTRIATATTYDSATNSTTFFWTEDLNNNGTLDPPAGTVNPTTTEDVNGNNFLDTHALPLSFTTLNSLGTVRIEQQERRYTWMLTMRQNATNTASVDVVVFFKRAIENIATDELLYNAVFNLGSTQVVVTYPTGTNTVTGLPLKPYMRRGSFVLDANNAFWYRISNVVDDNAGNAVLTLDTPANASNTSIPTAPPRAMFPRGVVDVFPIGTKAFR